MRFVVTVVALVFLAAGCGTAEDEPSSASTEPRVVSVDEARDVEDGTLVELGGAVYADDRPMRVCDALAESYPPQCGGGIVVTGVTWEELPDVQRASGVTWTDAGVGLVGEMRGGALHVSEILPWRARPQSPPPPAPPQPDTEEPVSPYE